MAGQSTQLSRKEVIKMSKQIDISKACTHGSGESGGFEELKQGRKSPKSQPK